MTCKQCGAQTYYEGQNFCGNCGARVIQAAPAQADAAADSEPAAAARPAWPSPSAAKAPRDKNKPLVIAAIVALIVILGGAGVYFATMRPAGKDEIARSDQAQDKSAETAGSSDTLPPPQEELPGSKTKVTPQGPSASAKSPSAPAGASRRTGVAGTYQTVRDTSVFESPSASSRVIASIPRGFKVNVVSSTGNWLEVRSTSGKPPGFIRRNDALPSVGRG